MQAFMHVIWYVFTCVINMKWIQSGVCQQYYTPDTVKS